MPLSGLRRRFDKGFAAGHSLRAVAEECLMARVREDVPDAVDQRPATKPQARYRPPRLVVYGRIADLTLQGGNAEPGDAGQNMMSPSAITP